MAASNFWNLFRFNNQVKTLFSQPSHHCTHTLRVFLLVCWVRGRRQAHNPTLTKIMRLTYNRSCSHNRPQTAACNAVYSISRRALLITRLGEQLPRPRQVSMVWKGTRGPRRSWRARALLRDRLLLWKCRSTSNSRRLCAIPRSLARGSDKSGCPRHGPKMSLILKGASDPRIRD